MIDSWNDDVYCTIVTSFLDVLTVIPPEFKLPYMRNKLHCLTSYDAKHDDDDNESIMVSSNSQDH